MKPRKLIGTMSFAVLPVGIVAFFGAVSMCLEIAKAQDDHGPDAKCSQWCAPKGHEGEATPPEGIPVITCAGAGEWPDGCAKQGVQCGEEHRLGCSEWCRSQCCSCCGI